MLTHFHADADSLALVLARAHPSSITPSFNSQAKIDNETLDNCVKIGDEDTLKIL